MNSIFVSQDREDTVGCRVKVMMLRRKFFELKMSEKIIALVQCDLYVEV